jgi:hypothetical protein
MWFIYLGLLLEGGGGGIKTFPPKKPGIIIGVEVILGFGLEVMGFLLFGYSSLSDRSEYISSKLSLLLCGPLMPLLYTNYISLISFKNLCV